MSSMENKESEGNMDEATSDPKTKVLKKKKRKGKNQESSSKSKETVKAWWVPKADNEPKEEKELNNVTLKFVAKQSDFGIPQVPIEVPENADSEELNKIVSSFLEKAGDVEEIPTFEFLVGEKILLSTIGNHLTELGISYELTTEVQYFERYPPPAPKDNLEHDDWVSSVKSSGEWLVTGCYDNTVQLWDISGMERGRGKRAHKLTIPAHKAPVKAVSWLNKKGAIKSFVSVESLGVERNGTKFATGSWDNTIKIWDGAISNSEGVGHEEEPDKKKVKKSKSQRLKTPIYTFVGHSESVSGIDWIDNNHFLSCSWDHSIRLWDIQAAGKITQINGSVAFFCLSYSPLNRTVLAGCADRQIKLYDPRAREGNIVQNKFSNHTKWVPSVMWSPHNENLFVSGSYDHKIKVWDRRSATSSLYNLLGHDEKVLSVDWSHADHIASGSADCTAQIYST
ncbi:Ribosome biogenesis protein WDR12-like protein [Armadillidium nasatum]|uniref:Ribosome biogenesis protein WDR12-like protein n=1 Tax=Armadillidium nasatum TaxID=96803 RepID=A0A5N5SVJ7_9CRUS|nr:Ribosome biogenesis protein WDR12-like protein [Armadillidium nasatum]